MQRMMTGVAAAFFLLGVDAVGAGWSHRYTPMPRGRTEAVAALPDGGLVLVASGAKNAILVLDADGQVRASRSVSGIPIAVTAGTDGTIFIGLISDSGTILTKLNADLTVAWSGRVNAGAVHAPLSMIRATDDGGIVALGTSFLAKIDSNGRVAWSTRPASSSTQLDAAIPAKDGGYMCVGSHEGRPWLARLSKDGELSWQRTYGDVNGRFRAVIETEGGYAVAGQSEKQAVVARLDATGAPIWAALTATWAAAHGIAALPGGYVVSGRAGGELQVSVLEPNGSTRWMRLLMISSDTIRQDEPIGQIFARVNDGVVVSLPIKPRDHQPDRSSVLLHKIDDAGNTLCATTRPGGVVFVPVRLASASGTAVFNRGDIKLPTAAVITEPIALTARPESCGPDADDFRVPEPEPSFKIDDWEKITADAERYRGLLAAKDFSALEKIAADLRTSRSPDPLRPHRGLTRFYDALGGSAEETTQLSRLREWSSKRPRSITAQVALADALVAAGWRRRGPGFASMVTDVGWTELRRLLEEAATALTPPRAGIESDPVYWQLAISLAHDHGTGDARALARRALALHPDGDIGMAEMRRLLPRWGGSPQAVVEFAEEASALTRKTHGDALYMWFAYQIAVDALQGQETFADYTFDWARVRQGGRDAIALASQWPPSYHRLAVLAWMFKDRETARELFARKQLDWYPDALAHWQSSTRYKDVRAWALPDEPIAVARSRSDVQPPPTPLPLRMQTKPAGPGVPSVAPDSSRWPQILLQMRVTDGDTIYERFSGFLVKTSRGLLAVSVLPPEPFNAASWKAVTRLREAFNRAEMWVPPSGTATLTISALIPEDPQRRRASVAMAIKPPKNAPTEVLELRHVGAPTEVMTRAAFIVACTWDGPRCKQTVFEGTITSVSTSHPGPLRELWIGMNEVVPHEALAGAAVLDTDGNVIAVATGRKLRGSSEHATTIAAELLDTIVP